MLWHFRDYDLDTERYELRRAGQAVLLEPKAFKVLAYLVQHHGRAVAKGDLLAAFWPGAAAVSYKEYALRNCLMKIRQALGDTRLPAPVIETVRGYGYRFVALVTALSPAPHDASGPSQEPPATRSAATLPDALPLLPEWRQLTVLRCGLVPPVRVERLDPEDFQGVVQAFYTMCEEVIAPFAGYIAHYDSDELLIYFGYPVAYEDAAVRAVRAGLALCATLPQRALALNRAPDLRLALRLSIHTGPVATGAAREAPVRTPTLSGAMLSVGKRLQAEAPPNTVLLSAATYALVQGYVVCEALPRPQAAPGDGLACYRVLRESPAQSRFEVAAARGLTPLVGREAEMAVLRDRWAQGQDGLGQVVLLCGEPGIGKSRLVQELRDHGLGSTTTQIVWRCSPYHQHSAFYPIIAALERALALTPDETVDARLRKLEAMLTPCALPLSEAVPLFAALLALPTPAQYPPLDLSPRQQRQKTLNTLVAWLLAEAQRQPVLLLVEDLHWSDPSLVEVLSLLFDQVPTVRLVMLLTCRPEFHSPWPVRAHFTSLTLSRLPRPQVAHMVARVAGTKTLPQEVIEQVGAKTDGVPLFVEELTKTVLESGLLREHEYHYELTGPLPSLAIPATLQDSLLVRLDRLATGKTVAQLGATIGRQFPYALLQAVAPLDEETLHHELARLVGAELLYQRGVPPQATYTFKHALVQEAAYQSLLTRTRQQYHQQVAQLLETRFPDLVETEPELVAYHYTGASCPAQAIPYWQQAGSRAYDRAAFREAVASFEQALQALASLPEDGDTRGLAIKLRLTLERPLAVLGEYGRCLALLSEAAALAMALDDRARLVLVLARTSQVRRTTGDLDGAIAAGQQAHELAAALGESALQEQASHRLGQAYYAIGDFGRAVELLRRNVEAADRESGRASTDVRIESRAWLARTLSPLGAFAEGRRHGEEALRIATLEGRGATPIVAHGCLGSLYLAKGDLEHAIRVLEQGLALCRASGDRTWLEIVAGLGYAYALQGRLAAGHTLVEEAIKEGIRTGALSNQSRWVAWLSEVWRLAGRGKEALQHARQALDLARQQKERGNEALALHQLGAVHAHTDPPDAAQAEAYYQSALALAEELGMRPLQAHCHHGLGTLYAATDQREHARAALAVAIALYRDMEMTFWLPVAEAALAQVEE